MFEITLQDANEMCTRTFYFMSSLFLRHCKRKINVEMEETSLLLNYLHYSVLQILKRQWILSGKSN
jgi:hypothetical protein